MDSVEEVKSKTNIANLVGEYVTLKKMGRNLKGLCPFHGEKTPSFMVNEELGIYKCFGCFPAKQTIRIPGGVKSIEEVVVGEAVMSGTGKPRRVLKTFKRPYCGHTIGLTTWMFADEVVMTEDHNVLAVDGSSYTMNYKNLSRRIKRYELRTGDKYHSAMEKYFPIKKIPAGQLKKGQCLLFPIVEEVQDITMLDLSDYITKILPAHGRKPRKINYKIAVDRDFLKLAGYYIAEGSNHRAYIRFSLGRHEVKFAGEIVRIVKKLFGLDGQIHVRGIKNRGSGIEVSVCHSLLSNIFENLFNKGADKKRIPEVFMHLSKEKQRVLIDAIKRGDGMSYLASKSKNIHNAVTTVSQALALQTREILLRLGHFPSVLTAKAKIDSKGTNHRKTYRVVWSEEAIPRYNLIYRTRNDQKYWLLPIRNLKKESFCGDVFNLMVEEDHTYIPRGFVVANCGAGGDVFNFLMAIEGLDFAEALHKLADKAGVKLPEFKTGETDVKKELIGVNTMAAEYFHYLLTKHGAGEEARKYLKDRKINEKLWETFKIGFSLPEWDGLSKYLVNKKGYREELLVAAGLAIEGGRGVYDRFRGRIMFPLLDSAGRIVGFSGRILPGLAKGDEGKYINSPETEIYHKGRMLYGFSNARSAIKKAGRAVLVEGQLDTISSYGAGISETVGVGGTALTIEMVEMLGKVTENITLALDNDPAGEAAMKRSIDLIEKRGMSIKMVEIDGGKDPDEIARNFPDKWKEMVDSAVPVYEFFFNRLIARHGIDSVEAIGKIVKEVVPMLASIENSVIREVWVRKLALKIGVDKQRIEEEMEKVRRNRGRGTENREQRLGGQGMDKDVAFLGRVIAAKESWRMELKKLFIGLPPVGAVGKLLVEILNRETVDLKELKKEIPEELFGVLSEAVLVSDEEMEEKDFLKLAMEWGRRVVKEEKSRLTEEIRSAEKDGQIEKIDNLMGKLVKLNAIEKRLDQS